MPVETQRNPIKSAKPGQTGHCFMLKPVQICRNLSETVENCRRLSKHVETLRNLTKPGEIRRNRALESSLISCTLMSCRSFKSAFFCFILFRSASMSTLCLLCFILVWFYFWFYPGFASFSTSFSFVGIIFFIVK